MLALFVVLAYINNPLSKDFADYCSELRYKAMVVEISFEKRGSDKELVRL